MYMGKKKENCYIKCTKCKKIFNNDITFLLIAIFSGIGAIMMGVYILV